jgi:hypothetical protein
MNGRVGFVNPLVAPRDGGHDKQQQHNSHNTSGVRSPFKCRESPIVGRESTEARFGLAADISGNTPLAVFHAAVAWPRNLCPVICDKQFTRHKAIVRFGPTPNCPWPKVVTWDTFKPHTGT